MRSAVVLGAAALVMLAAGNAAAQGHDHHHGPGTNAGSATDPEIAALLERVRAATAEFRDPDAATRAGYRRVGVDFPAMGEHWINPVLLIRREMNFERPQVLTYATVDGVRTLTGVVYAVGLLPGEQPPAVAGAARPWHEHNGSITDEILPRSATRATSTDRIRFSVLHFWTEVPNPDGPFATDNWALPFVRLGFRPPVTEARDAARMLALVASGDEYFVAVVQASGGAEASARARPLVGEARNDAAALLAGAQRGAPLPPELLATLGARWQRLLRELAPRCTECAEALAG